MPQNNESGTTCTVFAGSPANHLQNVTFQPRGLQSQVGERAVASADAQGLQSQGLQCIPGWGCIPSGERKAYKSMKLVGPAACLEEGVHCGGMTLGQAVQKRDEDLLLRLRQEGSSAAGVAGGRGPVPARPANAGFNYSRA